jgi:hypothetical protein
MENFMVPGIDLHELVLILRLGVEIKPHGLRLDIHVDSPLM